MKKYIVFLFFSLLLFKGYSQFSLKGEAQNYIYAQNPTIKYPIDTSLKNFEEYNFENTETWEFANTSILGSAQIPLSFISKKNIGFQDGNIFFNNYHYAIDKIKYYEVQKFPFSQINYLIGSKLEQSARITHAQNIKNRFLFGIDAMGLSSSGFYDLNQRSRNFGFSFYGHYASMNNRYHLKTNFTYSSVKINELGGIQEDILTTPSQNKLFFTNLIDDATTKQSQFNIELINSYHFGVFSIDSLNDTTKVRYFYPTFGIDYSIGTSIVKQSFVDYATDSSYGVFYQNKDSLYYTPESTIGQQFLSAAVYRRKQAVYQNPV